MFDLKDTELKCCRCDADLSDPSEMLNLIKNKLLCSCCASEVAWQEERDFENNLYNGVN